MNSAAALRISPLIVSLLLAGPNWAWAADGCPASPWRVARDEIPAGTTLSADRLDGTAEFYRLSGDVVVSEGERMLDAASATWYPLEQRLSAAGQIGFSAPGMRLEGESAEIRLGRNEADILDARYRMRLDPPRHGQHTARGDAERVRQNADGVVRLDDAGYTTCPPGEPPAWALRANRVELDQSDGIGTARGMTLELGGVPVFYAPWFSFPIGDQRKSGFLFPEIGDSDTTGFSLRTPWYWNIAPQADATLTPRYMARRGTAIESEWRYLTGQGLWLLDADVLDRDEQTGDRRSYYRLRHEGHFGARWDTRIDAARVSDTDYFEDFSDDPTLAAESHLDRRAELIYRGDRYRVLMRASRYQTIDETLAATSRPYERLPQVLLTGRWPLQDAGLSLSLRSEVVRFDRRDTVTGDRLHLRPRVEWAQGGTAWFTKPALTLWHSSYALNDAGAGVDQYPDVSVPLFSFDGGLFFERDREGGALQTLEPRLFYLYAPYQAQAEIPVFDSGAYDFGLAQLFRENRFSGTDRIADANQLTLALSTRLLDAGGRETLSAGIGQIVYFDDRRVQLSGDAVTTDTRSPIVTELKARLDRNWSTAVSAEFDSKTDQTTQSQIRVSYRETGNRLFNLTHRYSREDVVADPEEQVDLSAAWPLNSSWLGYARWNYSLDEENTLNSLIGLEYDSCCWSLRLLNRRYLTDNGDTNRSVYLQLVLKSLGDFGRDAGTQLQRDILGYSDPYN